MGERTDAVSGNDRTDAIRRDIERTQREMSRTIDEIQHRLSPQYIKQQAKDSAQQMMQRTKDSVREAGVHASRSFVGRVRSNPIGAAMVGVGLWMLMRDSDRDVEVEFIPDYQTGWDTGARPTGWDASGTHFSSVAEYRDFDYEAGSTGGGMRDRVSGAADTARERISGVAEAARDRVSGVAGATKERVGEAVNSLHQTTHDAKHAAGDAARRLSMQARYGMQRARYQSRDLMNESPLIVGLAAIAAGAIIGALIPETDKEHELMGEHRDRFVERGREMAREGVDRARDVAKAATSAATDAAKSELKSETDQRSSRTDIGTNIGLGGTQI